MAQRIELFGIGIDNMTMSQSVARVSEFVASGTAHQHVVINVDKVVKLSKDPELVRIVQGCDMVNADGMPIVWASRLVGTPLQERVAGIDLFLNLVAHASTKAWPIYLLGAKPDVLQAVIQHFNTKFPSLIIVGSHDGYWQKEDELALIDTICASGAKLLFVAISSPKKEFMLSRIQEHGSIPFAMGVGGSFDVIAGKVKRAPLWMQSYGLEWFYRFLQEPRRMFRRYFIDALSFGGLLLKELFKQRLKKLR